MATINGAAADCRIRRADLPAGGKSQRVGAVTESKMEERYPRVARFKEVGILNSCKTGSDSTPPSGALDRAGGKRRRESLSTGVALSLSSDDALRVNRLSALPYDSKKVWVQSLAMDCPLGKPVEACALRDLRKLNAGVRTSLVDQMTESRLEEIIEIHRRCRAEREALGTANK